MKGNQVYKYSSAFYLKAIIFGLAGWAVLNLIFGNPPLGGHYYVPVFLIIYLLIQLTYAVDLRKDALHIKRFGMGAKVSYETLHKVAGENGTVFLYLQDGRQYNIPISRFDREAQKQLPDQINELWAGAKGENFKVEQKTESDIPDYLMKEQAKQWITQLLDSGQSKKEVFENLKGRGVKDSKLAMMISSVPDEVLCMLHERKNNTLVTIYAFFCVLTVWITYVTVEPNLRLFILVLQVSISLLLIWGFFSFKLLAYNVYIVINLISIPKEMMTTFATNDLVSMIGIGIGIGVLMLAYVWYVRSSLYPDIGFMSVKKDKAGQYRFAE